MEGLVETVVKVMN